MIFFKFLIFITFVCISNFALADNHEGENELPIPAIVIEEEVEEPEDPAWTYKFLIPTSVAIATIVILGNVIQYFRQVTRKRYKVKE